MKTLITTLIAIGVLAFGTTVSAALIEINDGGSYDGTTVGYVDTLLAAADKKDLPKDQSGNVLDETAWVNSILDPNDTATFTFKTGNVTYYSTDNNTTTFAFSLMDSDPRPDYFLIKNATFQALFENNAYVGWGVFDVNDILLGMNLGEWDGEEGFTISHVTEFTSDGGRGGLCNPDEDPTCLSAVPIPAAVWLFGSGLIGLVGVARRKVTDNNA